MVVYAFFNLCSLYTPWLGFHLTTSLRSYCWRERILDPRQEQNEGHAGIFLDEALGKRKKHGVRKEKL
jgi:hypothetical protein